MTAEKTPDGMDRDGPRLIPVDAHVHIYPGWRAGDVFDAAAANMGLRSGDVGALLLTETAGVDAFGGLEGSAGGWAVEETGEDVSRRLVRGDGARMLLVAGRQIVAAEGIEIHGFGTRGAIPDGRPAREVLAALADEGVLTCLPWGVGKWSGARGALVRALIGDGPAGMALADSGVRPGLWPRPALLAAAEAAGRAVLAGSDPLPVPGGWARAGGYGVRVAAGIDGPAPFAALAAALTGAPPRFGRLERTGAFLANQVAMQIRKRTGKARSGAAAG